MVDIVSLIIGMNFLLASQVYDTRKSFDISNYSFLVISQFLITDYLHAYL